MIKELFAKVAQRQKEHAQTKAADIRGLIVAIAEAELGIAGTARKLDIDHGAALLLAEGLSEADLRENVELYKRRCHWAEQAGRAAELQAEADRTEAERLAFIAADAERARKAAEELERLTIAAHAACGAVVRVVEAKAELEGTAALVVDEALEAQLRDVNARIAAMRNGLNPHGIPGEYFGPNRWASLEHAPALLVTQTRAMLAGQTKPERRAELERQLVAAERRVKECQDDIARLEKRRAEIVAKQTPADLLNPANFAIVRQQTAPKISTWSL